jgi:hypothetical protein
MNCSAVTIACWNVDTKPPGSAIPGAPSTRLITCTAALCAVADFRAFQAVESRQLLRSATRDDAT